MMKMMMMMMMVVAEAATATTRTMGLRECCLRILFPVFVITWRLLQVIPHGKYINIPRI